MPSPFPGMNPWIEQKAIWQDFHDSFLPAAREALNAQIVPRYLARIQEHVFVEEFTGDEHFVGISDVSVVDGDDGAHPRTSAAFQSLVAPVQVRQVEPEAERQIYLEIHDCRQRRLVTVVELLSPANKRIGRIRNQDLARREQYLESDAHFVEIDLLRGGLHVRHLRRRARAAPVAGRRRLGADAHPPGIAVGTSGRDRQGAVRTCGNHPRNRSLTVAAR